ncbi:unnamed protein product [Candida verbasci]|uniref:Ribosomal protein S2 n=1 Tax=Candida verbasci TaxID=1227364 RepID=A0A9W4XCK4_9ASCO|nr:unnamed protein product [Candida verbasci]
MLSLYRIRIRNIKNKSFIRLYSIPKETPETLSQKELREKAIADALAKEEEQIYKTKQLRELTNEITSKIDTLNQTPLSLMKSRLLSLNDQISKLNQDKVKQLDDELKDYIIKNLSLPSNIIEKRSFLEEESKSTENKETNSSSFSKNQLEFPNLKPTPDYKEYSQQELFVRQMNNARINGNLGSTIKDVYNPKKNINQPPISKSLTIANLMAAGCHLGNSTQNFRPSNQPFIYGVYDGLHIIDLNQTIEKLKLASNVIEGISEKGGIILYVATHKNWSIKKGLINASKRSKGYYVSKKWIPGTITNYKEFSKQIKDGRIKIDMENNQIDTVNQETKSILPDLVVLLNPVDNKVCIKECLSRNIPTIALCDTDMEPSLITYPIPCNDDSERSINLMLGVLSKSAEIGLNKRLDAIKTLKEKQL